MIATARELLIAFDGLPPEEKKQAAVEIIRRSTAEEDLPPPAYDEMTAELFRSYEAEEAERTQP